MFFFFFSELISEFCENSIYWLVTTEQSEMVKGNEQHSWLAAKVLP